MKFPDDFKKLKHRCIPGATQWTYSDSNDDMLYSVVGGGIGIHGDGVKTFEMYDTSKEDVVLSFATVEDINEYLDSQS